MEAYNSKMESVYDTYRFGYCDRKGCMQDLAKECDRMETMLSNMFHFDLISEKDYTEVAGIPSKVRCKFFYKMLNL